MKLKLSLFISFVLVVGSLAQVPNGTEKPKAEATVKPVVITVPAKMIDDYAKAQMATANAKAALEASAVYKTYQLAYSFEQQTMLYAMGEVGAKPSECAPVFDKDGKLVHLECKPKVKP